MMSICMFYEKFSRLRSNIKALLEHTISLAVPDIIVTNPSQ